ncbi:MAG: cupin domain-containing protein, partial [Thermomicrobiales bacterium]
LNDLELVEAASDADSTLQMRAVLPIYAAKGATSSAVVYFEIEPGKRVGRHTDSAEEIVLVLQGEAEALIDGERGRLSSGQMALIPAMAPHDVANVGQETLRVVGFFAGATLVHTFYEPYLPGSEVAIFVNGRGAEEVFAASRVVASAEP